MEKRIVIQPLKELLDDLQKTKYELEKKLKKAPNGTLECKICRTTPQFYCKKDGKSNYIKKADRELAAKLAQRDYDKKILSEINEKILQLTNFLTMFDLEKIYSLYDELALVRKQLVEPVFVNDEEYVNQWMGQEYQGKAFEEGKQEIYSERGERVRSKSEKIIADKLFLKNIPYRYEKPIYLKGFGTVYPDFCCLSVSRRKEIIWEHFGMMGDSEYSRKALHKMDLYTQNGYYQGDNIIYTFESSENPMNTQIVDKLIKAVF